MGKVGAPVDRIRLPATKGSYRYRSSSDAETLSSGIFTRRMLRSGRGLHVGLLGVRSCEVTLPIVAILIGNNDEKYSFPIHVNRYRKRSSLSDLFLLLPTSHYPSTRCGIIPLRCSSVVPPSPTGLSPRMVHGVNAR